MDTMPQDTSQEVSSQAYVISPHVGYPLRVTGPLHCYVQVLRTLLGCPIPYPRIHIALPASLLGRSHHYASGYTTHLDHVLVPLDPRDQDT